MGIPNSTNKKMLYISICDEGLNSSIRFEIEDFFEDPQRPSYADIGFPEFSKNGISQSLENLDALGFHLIVGLMIPSRLKDRKGRRWAQVVYTQHNSRRSSVYIDEEPYRVNPDRKFCTSFPLETIDHTIASMDRDLAMKVAKNVFEYLPIDL